MQDIFKNFCTVAKCLFVIIRREGDNQCLFIVHRLRFRLRLRIGFVFRFRASSFLTKPFLHFTTNFCIHEFAKGDFVNTTL